MGRDVDERELVRRLTDPDPEVRDAAWADDSGRAFRPFLLNELGLVLADDARSGSWPHAVYWLEFIVGNGYDFDYLMTKLAPRTEPVPYEESVFVTTMSEDEYLELMAELAVEWQTAARGLAAGLGLAGHDGPPVFSSEAEPGTGPGLPPPRADPDTWRSIAGAIAALNSPLEWVRSNAVSYLAGLGHDVIDTLHAVRRSRMRARRAVLAAVADIGWDELDARDRRLVERLIRIRVVGGDVGVDVGGVADQALHHRRDLRRGALLQLRIDADAFAFHMPIDHHTGPAVTGVPFILRGSEPLRSLSVSTFSQIRGCCR